MSYLMSGAAVCNLQNSVDAMSKLSTMDFAEIAWHLALMEYGKTQKTTKDRERSRLQQLLAQLEAIPTSRRVSECADERAQTVRALLHELEDQEA